MSVRIGNGFDIHRFSDDPARRLILGGVELPDAQGLHGHSDADVIAHAVGDALLGAAGLGDLGTHFPDTDERWRGVDSLELLTHIVEMLGDNGWAPVNADCSVIAEHPKLSPYREQMERNLTAVVGAPVTIKGRRAEGIGGLGRGEGIACLVSALVETALVETALVDSKLSESGPTDSNESGAQ